MWYETLFYWYAFGLISYGTLKVAKIWSLKSNFAGFWYFDKIGTFFTDQSSLQINGFQNYPFNFCFLKISLTFFSPCQIQPKSNQQNKVHSMNLWGKTLTLLYLRHCNLWFIFFNPLFKDHSLFQGCFFLILFLANYNRTCTVYQFS